LRTWHCPFPWSISILLKMYISFTLSVSPSLQVVYRFVGYLLFPFCIKEEYKTNDSSTNRVADQQYIVKQNVHEFSSSPFYFQSLLLSLSTLLFFYYISFMFCRCSIFGNFLTVTRHVSSFFESHAFFCL
jgi:hypothetical protein